MFVKGSEMFDNININEALKSDNYLLILKKNVIYPILLDMSIDITRGANDKTKNKN